MLEWQEWIFPVVEGGEFPHLQQFCIQRCPKLKKSLPRCLPPSIENFEISACPSLEARFPRLPSEDFFWLQDGNRMLLRRFDKRPPAPGLQDSNVV
ncbi:hypothetical protein Dsin_010828 [Dipteronia sinensis]|uniref:Uncharacterized protein n=2 Tax=Dipteronia sinensis TaxID=43782 RepID=A0AAE0ATI4_9ROSI|nr:hypothetical protein Dsin_010828 [Dipteronia sinensis]